MGVAHCLLLLLLLLPGPWLSCLRVLRHVLLLPLLLLRCHQLLLLAAPCSLREVELPGLQLLLAALAGLLLQVLQARRRLAWRRHHLWCDEVVQEVQLAGAAKDLVDVAQLQDKQHSRAISTAHAAALQEAMRQIPLSSSQQCIKPHSTSCWLGTATQCS
jgi:hypothetical protein